MYAENWKVQGKTIGYSRKPYCAMFIYIKCNEPCSKSYCNVHLKPQWGALYSHRHAAYAIETAITLPMQHNNVMQYNVNTVLVV